MFDLGLQKKSSPDIIWNGIYFRQGPYKIESRSKVFNWREFNEGTAYRVIHRWRQLTKISEFPQQRGVITMTNPKATNIMYRSTWALRGAKEEITPQSCYLWKNTTTVRWWEESGKISMLSSLFPPPAFYRDSQLSGLNHRGKRDTEARQCIL